MNQAFIGINGSWQSLNIVRTFVALPLLMFDVKYELDLDNRGGALLIPKYSVNAFEESHLNRALELEEASI